jgi:hypothetical protein
VGVVWIGEDREKRDRVWVLQPRKY